jgi:glycerol uptake facilitator-like aquaporin
MLRRLFAEGLGTALLLSLVVGSGIMGQTLSDGNAAIALLTNSIATGAGLMVLISIFGPVSGAHFNPLVTLMFAIRREISVSAAVAYVMMQCVGAILGVWLAHAMFGLSILQISTKARDGTGLYVGEMVATFGLILAILATLKHAPDRVPLKVGLYITAAYWFTSSTSFANPAVTLARSLTNTFSGIAPHSVPAFVAAQFIGAGLSMVAVPLLGFLKLKSEQAA